MRATASMIRTFRSMTALSVNLFGFAAMLLSGCDGGAPTSAAPAGSSAQNVAPARTAEEVLTRMAAAYEKAKSYEDSGEIQINETTAEGEKNQTPKFPFSIAFQRPNRLRLHQFGASVVADGENVFASVVGIEDQVLTRPAPDHFSLDDLSFDPQLTQSIEGGIVGVHSPVLNLLFSENPIKDDLAAKPTLLDDKHIGDDVCRRVEVKTDAGSEIYWVDSKSYLLRRFEFATDALRKKVAPEGQLKDIGIRADFKGVRVDSQIAEDAFKFEVPPAARLVKQFLQPAPEAPSPLLGQKPQGFSFVDLDGNKVTSESLQGKVVVLDIWATWCGWCFKGFPNLQKVYDQYKDNEKVAILTVNTDETSKTDEEVRKSFEEAQLTLPIVRDVDDYNKAVLDVKGLPTAFVFGTDGTIQQVEMGYKEDLAESLPKLIERLIAGENVAEETFRQYEQKRSAYEREAADLTVGKTSEVEIPQAKIEARSEPKHFRLTELWTNEEVKRTGNLLVIEPADAPATIYVIESPGTVLALDVDGKIGERFDLDLPTQTIEGQEVPTPISFMRTAVDAAGQRWFAAFATTGQQVYLFDDRWQHKLSYPTENDGQHAGLGDVQIADLTGDGQIEMLVGYLGPIGTQAVSLDGKRLWSRRLENVLRVALWDGFDGQSVLLCTNNRGTLASVDAKGQPLTEINLKDRNLYHVVSAELDGQQPSELCALSMVEDGVAVAVGLNAERQEAWHYTLPRGIHSFPVEPVSAGRLRSDGPLSWLLPAADGSLHILSNTGSVVDKFNTGATITGVATMSLEGSPVLLMSSDKGVSAWKVEPK